MPKTHRSFCETGVLNNFNNNCKVELDGKLLVLFGFLPGLDDFLVDNIYFVRNGVHTNLGRVN